MGKKLYFGVGSSIWVQFADGRGMRNLLDLKTLNSNYNTALSPVWSHDGTAIAFAAQNALEKRLDIFLVKADGSNPTMIHSHLYTVFDEASISNISWRSDDRELLYTLYIGNWDEVTLSAYAGYFQVSIFFSDAIETNRTEEDNIQVSKFEPVQGSVRIAMGIEQGFLLDNRHEVIVYNPSNGNNEIWVSIDNPNFRLTITELTWYFPNSIFFMLRDYGGSFSNSNDDIYTIWRIDKQNDGTFLYYEILKVQGIAIRSFSVSPDKKAAYFSGIQNNQGTLYRMSLDEQGNYITDQAMGGGIETELASNYSPIHNL